LINGVFVRYGEILFLAFKTSVKVGLAYMCIAIRVIAFVYICDSCTFGY